MGKIFDFEKAIFSHNYLVMFSFYLHSLFITIFFDILFDMVSPFRIQAKEIIMINGHFDSLILKQN